MQRCEDLVADRPYGCTEPTPTLPCEHKGSWLYMVSCSFAQWPPSPCPLKISSSHVQLEEDASPLIRFQIQVNWQGGIKVRKGYLLPRYWLITLNTICVFAGCSGAQGPLVLVSSVWRCTSASLTCGEWVALLRPVSISFKCLPDPVPRSTHVLCGSLCLSWQRASPLICSPWLLIHSSCCLLHARVLLKWITEQRHFSLNKIN